MNEYKLNAVLKMAVWHSLPTGKTPSEVAFAVFEQRPDLEEALYRYWDKNYEFIYRVIKAIEEVDTAWERNFPTREASERESRQTFSDLIETVVWYCKSKFADEAFITPLAEMIRHFVSDPQFLCRRSRSGGHGERSDSEATAPF
jgi:hypothetical protein